jgi:recombination protein RecA
MKLMTKRTRPRIDKAAPSYFVGEKPSISFIPSGCTLLDCVLGGGYALGRIVNIVGDKSTAKTALATEAMINFVNQFPKGQAAYRESEAAFDKSYAEAMGLKLDKIDFGDEDKPLLTVEDFAKDLDHFLNTQIKANAPGIYVLDSLDALSDDAEMDAEIGKATYGVAKAKMLSTFFRKTARKLEKAATLLVIVSQIRDNIGVTFGAKYKRSGGKALDFYSSQVLFLAHVKTLKKTISKVERPIGISVRAKVTKNKVGLPFREAAFNFMFGFGIDDIGANAEWLKEVGRLEDIDVAPGDIKEYLHGVEGMRDADYYKERLVLSEATKRAWADVEQTFIPTRRKYG